MNSKTSQQFLTLRQMVHLNILPEATRDNKFSQGLNREYTRVVKITWVLKGKDTVRLDWGILSKHANTRGRLRWAEAWAHTAVFVCFGFQPAQTSIGSAARIQKCGHYGGSDGSYSICDSCLLAKTLCWWHIGLAFLCWGFDSSKP